MSTPRPSRLKVAYIYLKRISRWRRSSLPYISGDAFADLADYVHSPPKWRNFNSSTSLRDAKIIYCRSHELQDFLNKNVGNLSAKVILAGNSDFEFHDVPINIPKSVRALFLQNSFISDNQFIFTIPIGIENFRLGVNGNPKYIGRKRLTFEKENRVLFGPLSPTHPVRNSVISTFGNANNAWDLLLNRLSPREYDRVSQKFRFIAAVRGNGVDTHRLWEALYRGLTPVVIRDGWWSSMEDRYPQVQVINNWTICEIENLVQEETLKNFNAVEIEALWMPYWTKLITSFLE